MGWAGSVLAHHTDERQRTNRPCRALPASRRRPQLLPSQGRMTCDPRLAHDAVQSYWQESAARTVALTAVSSRKAATAEPSSMVPSAAKNTR